MWLVRQTREQQGRDINGYMEPKGNMGNVDNMGYMDNIRDNIGIDNAGNTGMDTLGQIGPRYEMVLLSDNDNEKMMSQYDEKQQKHVLKSVNADYKKRGSGNGRTMDGRIRILKREKDLRLKRRGDGRIWILKRKKLTKQTKLMKDVQSTES